MKGLVKYLKEIYENCEISFEVYIDDENIFKANPNESKENIIENIFFIGTKQVKIMIEEKHKDSMKILEFCIKDKIKMIIIKKKRLFCSYYKTW
jgi:hypothetical protein